MKPDNIVTIMVSADWHLGATDPYRFRLELLNLVKAKLEEEHSLDLFIVAGDTFDMKEYLSSEVVKVFFLIMIDLLKITEPYNTIFRFEEGTRTHDAMQLDTLDIIFTKLLNSKRVKFIQEAEMESLLGLNILYVPEEYIVDMDSYYKDLFDKKYDFIFGHGMTDIMWYAKNQNDKMNKQSSAPVFSVDKLCNIANYIYFGHIHYHTKAGAKNRFKYVGPVSRWEFDKEQDCGLYYIYYDKSTGLAIEDFLINDMAPIMPTIELTIDKDIDLNKLNSIITINLKPVNDADRIRLLIYIDTTLQSYLVMRDFITALFGKLPNVKLVIKPIEPKEEKEEPKLSMEELVDDKPYLYDKTLHDESKIAAFIKKKGGINISLENILEVISPKTNKIK